MTFRITLAVAAVSVLLLTSCDEPGMVPADSGGPTPDAIAAEIRPMIEPLRALIEEDAVEDGNFTVVAPSVCGAIVEQITGARAAHSGTSSGQAALARIDAELEEIIRRARDEDKWGVVLCAIDVHEVVHPGMHLMRRLRERALLHANRPHVVVKGFFDDNDRNEMYIFLKVTLRRGYTPWVESGAGAGDGPVEGGETAGAAGLEKDETHMVQVRLNEEFYGLRLVDIYGNKRGVTLEYLADPGHFFRVPGPKRELTPQFQTLRGTN